MRSFGFSITPIHLTIYTYPHLEVVCFDLYKSTHWYSDLLSTINLMMTIKDMYFIVVPGHELGGHSGINGHMMMR